MSVKTVTDLLPAYEPAPPSLLPEPAGDPQALFPPSAELGEQLRQLHTAQAEIDRRKVEELARLLDIQDRD